MNWENETPSREKIVYITTQGLKVRFFYECFLLNKPKASEAIARVEKPRRNPSTVIVAFYYAKEGE